jgi:tetratricopeptide (TPR) repeat protein
VIYQVGRALGRTGQARAAVVAYQRLAATTADPAMRANAAYQAGGYGLRRASTTIGPAEAAQMRVASTTRPRTWAEALGLSRLCRLAAINAREPARAARHLDDAYRQAEAARRLSGDDLALAENDRQLLDVELDIALLGKVTRAAVDKYALAAGAYDPHCIDHLTRLGLAEAAYGDYAAAANRFEAAGALGTLDGAAAWYLAGQCFDRLGRRGQAAHAMGRCLELDPAAVEPRGYLIAQRKG